MTRYTPYGEVDVQSRQVAGSASRIVLKNDYDSSGALIKAAKPYNDNNQKTSYVYGKNGELSTVTNPLGQQTKYYYSNAVYAINGSSGGLQSTVKAVEPDGKETWSYSDKLGQVVKTQEQSATKLRLTTNRYTPFGYLSNQTVTANGITQSTSYGYDAIGSLIHVTDSLGQNYDYVYNSAGQVTNVKINGATQRTNVFNEIGLLLKKTNAAGVSEFNVYKPNGLLNQYKDENGLTHTYTYTDYNELSRESVKNSTGTEVYWRAYTYDPLTRLLTGISTKDAQNQSYQYDQWKRLYKQTAAGKTYSLGYDNFDRLSQILYPDNKAVTYTYDNLSRIQTVSYPDMGTVTYAYATGNNLNQYTISTPNGINQTRLTDAFDELTSVKSTNSSGAALWTETFGYDGMGNIKSIDRNGKRYDYTYDSLNRITQETSAAGNVNAMYTYDAKGNISTIDSSEEPSSKLINQSYSYNALNQLSGYTSPTAAASYTYYGDGLRASKTVNGVKTQYVYLNGRVIEELNASGNTIGRNIWGNELLYRKDAVANKAGFYSYNGHGDVVAIRDSTGAVLNSYDYDIWGNVTSKFEQMSNPFKYTGEIYDDESGLIYLRARYYNPVDKRFINEDTYEGDITNPLSLNLYTYVYNNPLIYIDPSGFDAACSSQSACQAYSQSVTITASDGLDYMLNPVIHDRLYVNEELMNGSISDEARAYYQVISNDYRNNACNYLGDLCMEGGSAQFIGSEDGFKIVSFTNAAGVTQTLGLNKEYGMVMCHCFTAGTTVLTEDGEKPIEEIQIGDKVLAKNEETGEIAYKEVEYLFQREVDELYNISIEGEVISTTDEHPFWVDGTGWVKTKDLQPGDKFLDAEGNIKIIDTIEVVRKKSIVYNFMVKDFHSYFVSNLKIWTHNACTLASARRMAVEKAWKEERALVEKTGRGTVEWSDEEIEELLRTGKVSGYFGHHINSVKGSPHLAGVSDNIEFVTFKDHLARHFGNWRKVTYGALLSRAIPTTKK